VNAAFYCVADARYFLGAVGTINSLRRNGAREEIFLLDCGLTDDQRAMLAGEATLVAAPGDVPPWLLKSILPLARPADVQILIDTDMIVTRPVAPLIERAGEGRMIAFCDRQQRFFAEWGELPGVGPARRGPYVSSGFVIAGGEVGKRVLELFDAHQSRVDFERTYWRQNVRDYPYLYADQDILNAILATSIEPEEIEALDERLAPTPPFRGLRAAPNGEIACAYRDGARPYVVHQYLRKPWLEPTFDGVYSQLLRRLVAPGRGPISVPQDSLPPRLRDDARGRAARRRTNARDFLRWHLGDRLPPLIGTRVENLRRRREAARG
jgi:hypothetical protein